MNLISQRKKNVQGLLVLADAYTANAQQQLIDLWGKYVMSAALRDT